MILIWRPFDRISTSSFSTWSFMSCCCQAPVILMSQNASGVKGSFTIEHDYLINLKAELEIRHLHEKIDHLLWINAEAFGNPTNQMELMEELAHKTARDTPIKSLFTVSFVHPKAVRLTSVNSSCTHFFQNLASIQYLIRNKHIGSWFWFAIKWKPFWKRKEKRCR